MLRQMLRVMCEGLAARMVLTVHDDGRWELSKGSLYDVTHLPCRSARYTPAPGADGSPATARRSDFPVSPGAEMPAVAGCNKQVRAKPYKRGSPEYTNLELYMKHRASGLPVESPSVRN